MVKRDTAKRKSPSDFFKKNPKVEHVLYKRGGKEPIETTLKSYTGDGFVFAHAVAPDMKRVNSLYSKGGEKPYTAIHNHPTVIKGENNSFPSYQDLYSFLIDDEIRTEAIYQHNPITNKSEGMYVIKKTKKTGISISELTKGIKNKKDAEMEIERKRPGMRWAFDKEYVHTGPLHDYFNLQFNQNDKFEQLELPKEERRKERQRLLTKIVEQMHLQIKYVPAEGYEYSPGIGFLPKKKKELDYIVSGVLAIGGILGSLIFLSSTFTGNAIADLTTKTTSFIGAGLLIVGLVAGFFWFRSRKK